MRGGALLGAGTGAGSLLGSELDGLAIDFATDMSMVIRDRTTPSNQFSGDPNSKLTYSSPSTKWILGSNGLYSSGTTLRTEYNSSGTALGVRIEEARTNLALRSNTFTSTWTPAALTNLTNTTTGPDGVSTSGTQLNETVTNTQHAISQSIVKAASAITYTASVFAKVGTGRTRICIALYSNTSGGIGKYAPFDVSGGQVGTITDRAPGYGTTTSSIENVGNGWYRCIVTTTTDAASTDIIFQILSDNGSGTASQSASYAGTVNNGCYIYQAQLEAGAFATSPIETAGSTVTRAADNINIATTLFPFNVAVGTGYVFGNTFSTGTGDKTFLTSGANGRMIFLQYYSATDHVASFDGTNSVGTQVVASPATFKGAVSWTGTTYRSAANGVHESGTFDGSMGAAGTLYLGTREGSVAPANGYIRRIMVLPVAYGQSQLEALTA